MKTRWKLLAALAVLLCIGIVVLTGWISFRRLMAEYGGEGNFSLTLPAWMIGAFLAVPALSLCLAGIVTLRAVRKTRRMEEAERASRQEEDKP